MTGFIDMIMTQDDYDEYDSHYEGWMEPITLGSLIKLKHENSGHLAHSHEISWGSGSQQQSVTAYQHWVMVILYGNCTRFGETTLLMLLQ